MNFYESRLFLATDSPVEAEDFKWLTDHTLCDKIDGVITKGPTQRLSDILLEVGLFPSRKEFYRKMKEGAILYNDTKVTNDFTIDTVHPSFFHEIRFGRKFLELVVPLK